MTSKPTRGVAGGGKSTQMRCQHCSAEFFCSPSATKDGKRKFCSRRCMGLSRSPLGWTSDQKILVCELAQALPDEAIATLIGKGSPTTIAKIVRRGGGRAREYYFMSRRRFLAYPPDLRELITLANQIRKELENVSRDDGRTAIDDVRAVPEDPDSACRGQAA